MAAAFLALAGLEFEFAAGLLILVGLLDSGLIAGDLVAVLAGAGGAWGDGSTVAAGAFGLVTEGFVGSAVLASAGFALVFIIAPLGVFGFALIVTFPCFGAGVACLPDFFVAVAGFPAGFLAALFAGAGLLVGAVLALLFGDGFAAPFGAPFAELFTAFLAGVFALLPTGFFAALFGVLFPELAGDAFLAGGVFFEAGLVADLDGERGLFLFAVFLEADATALGAAFATALVFAVFFVAISGSLLCLCLSQPAFFMVRNDAGPELLHPDSRKRATLTDSRWQCHKKTCQKPAARRPCDERSAGLFEGYAEARRQAIRRHCYG